MRWSNLNPTSLVAHSYNISVQKRGPPSPKTNATSQSGARARCAVVGGHHIEGQAGRSCANICCFCGSRDECTIRLPLQTRSTRKRMVVAVSSCPWQPSAICWSRMSMATKANPCTNRPVNCPQCTTTLWLYSMAAHFAAVHPNDPIPHGLREEEASVRGWSIDALKSGKKKQKVAGDMPTPSIHPFTNTSANPSSSSSSSSSSFSSFSTAPPMPPTTSHTMPPSESEATTEGDCRTRPLKSTGKRARDKRRLDALLEAGKKRVRPTSGESSDDADCCDRPLDKRS